MAGISRGKEQIGDFLLTRRRVMNPSGGFEIDLMSAIESALAAQRTQAIAKYRLSEIEVSVIEQLVRTSPDRPTTDANMGDDLGLSQYTVANHLRHIGVKMGARKRINIAVKALREGLVA